jgi:hypothetical protein
MITFVLLLLSMIASTPTTPLPAANSTQAQSTSQASGSIADAQRTHNRIFGVYVFLLFLTVIGTYWVWKSGNKVQDAVQAEANARIVEAKQGVEALENQNLTLRGQVATLETKASEATSALAGLEKQAADAKAGQQKVEIELEKQKERTAIAEKNLLELQQTLADRNLTDDQINEIGKELVRFHGQEYDVTMYQSNPESLAIAERVHIALQVARWKFIPMTEWRTLMPGVVGIQIWHHPDADAPTKEEVAALVAVLNKNNLKTVEMIANPINNPKHDRIAVSVGTKR